MFKTLNARQRPKFQAIVRRVALSTIRGPALFAPVLFLCFIRTQPVEYFEHRHNLRAELVFLRIDVLKSVD